MRVLVVNAGSSSLKLGVIGQGDEVEAGADLPATEPERMGQVLGAFLADHPDVDAAGHRIVHGGPGFSEPVVLDDGVVEALGALADLAPLQNPPGLAAIAALRALRPSMPQVACFDTAFHAGMPAAAATYALPGEWRRRWPLRRYGFHGLSHAWASRRAAALLGRPACQLRLVTAHIGAGASLAAVAGGRSVDTSMGFTPMEGLVMATRSGSVDPGLVLWVQRQGGLTATEVEAALEHRSGLLGLSGRSGDLRQVLAAADAGDPDSALAYATYVYRIGTGVGAMAAALGGIDGLVFTGGAGAASPRLRADAVARLGFLGVAIDGAANRAALGDAVVSPGPAPAAVVVVEAREDLEIVAHVRRLLGR